MKKSELYGMIGSAIACLLLFLLLWFINMGITPPPEEEGIIVSFGSADAGGGYGETPQTAAVEPVSPPPTPAQPTPNDLMTQEDESLAMAEQSKEEARRKVAQEAEEQRRREREEQERIAAEQRAREAALAEQRKREQEAIDRANKMGGLFGNNQNSDGNGNTQGNTTEGNPLGKGTSGGNSWSLNGRSLHGKITTPAYERNVEGRVVVNIRVDASGRVIAASVGASTISDPVVREAARKAALSTRFSAGSSEVSGSITFNFRLN